MAKRIRSLDYLSSLDPEKKKNLFETFNKEQLCKHQVKQNSTIVHTAVYLESNDIDSMFVLVQEIQHICDSPYELLKQGTEQVTDNHQEWWRLEFQDTLSLKPNHAPNWDTADII
jgi:hypothetical protein